MKKSIFCEKGCLEHNDVNLEKSQNICHCNFFVKNIFFEIFPKNNFGTIFGQKNKC